MKQYDDIIWELAQDRLYEDTGLGSWDSGRYPAARIRSEGVDVTRHQYGGLLEDYYAE